MGPSQPQLQACCVGAGGPVQCAMCGARAGPAVLCRYMRSGPVGAAKQWLPFGVGHTSSPKAVWPNSVSPECWAFAPMPPLSTLLKPVAVPSFGVARGKGRKTPCPAAGCGDDALWRQPSFSAVKFGTEGCECKCHGASKQERHGDARSLWPQALPCTSSLVPFCTQ